MTDSIISSGISLIPELYFGTPNLFLTAKTGNGTFSEDSLGNLIEDYTEEIIEVSVRRDVDNKEYEAPGEIGRSAIVLLGRCVNPKKPIINYEQSYPGYLLDDASLEQLYGTFTFIPIPQNRFKSVTNRFGMKIKGYFSMAARV